MSLKMEVKFISPDMAETILATTSFNRPVAASRVITLANAMRLGKWQLNGEPIIISETGKLLDGQHRLYAIMEAKKAVQLVIVTGAPDSAFETIDTGRIRSGGDILAMRGHKHSTTLSAASSIIWRLYHKAALNETCPPIFQLAVVERYHSLEKWAPFVQATKACLPRGVFLGALGYLEDVAQAPLFAERFFGGVTKGANLDSDDPILAMRNRMLNMRAEGHIMNVSTTWATIARTLSAIEKGERIQRISIDKSFGPIRRPALWEEHMKTLPDRLRLDDTFPEVHSQMGQGPRMALGRKVQATRNIALAKEAVAAAVE